MKTLLRHLSVWAACLLCLTAAKAQESPDSILLEKFLLDFSVPDMPAFKSLGTDPSEILRPSDVKKFAAMISPFYSGGKGVIPKNFALETAPWKLASRNWRLSDYKTSAFKRFLYRSSFSMGTVNDSSNYAVKLGVGYRVSFLSEKADVYRAPELLEKIYQIGRGGFDEKTVLTSLWVVKVVAPPVEERPEYYQKNITAFDEFLKNIEIYLKEHPDSGFQKAYDDYVAALAAKTASSPNVIKAAISGKTLEELIENYKKNNWNASRTDIALAWVGESKDSLLAGARFSSVSAWITQALRVHRGGQLLLGLHASLPRSEGKDSTRFDLAGSLRYYLGTRDFRGFLEAQYKYQQRAVYDKSLLLNLGAEFRLGGQFWVVASAGINNYFKESDPLSKLVSSIDLRYGFNGKR